MISSGIYLREILKEMFQDLNPQNLFENCSFEMTFQWPMS